MRWQEALVAAAARGLVCSTGQSLLLPDRFRRPVKVNYIWLCALHPNQLLGSLYWTISLSKFCASVIVGGMTGARAF